MLRRRSGSPGRSAPRRLAGFDDWSNLFFNFQGLADFGDDGTIHPVPDEPDPETVEDATRFLGGLLAPSVSVAVTGPATALPGQTLTYGVDVANDGRGPALGVGLTATRPDASTASFDLGGIVVGASAARSMQFTVPSNACPSTLTLGANATFTDFAGRPGSAGGSASTQVLDIAPPVVNVSLTPNSLAPPNHTLRVVGATVLATDECDPNPQVRLLSVTSSEPDNGLGDGDVPGDIAGAATGTDDRSFSVRSERAGVGPGRTYTVVYQATDASGNSATATATVTVPRGGKG